MLGWSLLAHSSRNAGDRAISIPPPALVPLASDDRVVFADAFDQPIALSATNPYTKAFRVSAEKLRDGTARALIVDLQFKANARTKGRIVIERRRNNIITDYEAVPNASPNTNDTAWISAQVVRDIRELRRDDDEVGIYVWNEAVDTLLVRDIRVRTTVRSPVR